ncbi:hypothetical protein JOC78_001369 [Bacillus ectoiniformans]|uniref:S-layer homology domain-containing protein n=1 Tax=Bacillus ectoiniformans TaxID=1494429 RepID=UPI00195E3C48|nr:S-layer homology domain-containing protein [Bacillus ectoiniformans]MBM7648427.1 hypothetical protein [Bacillus ectoiniformans]
MSKTKKQKFFYSALSASVAAGALVSFAPQAGAQENTNFTDVKAADHFYEAVKSLNARGVIKGYEDKTFRPYANVTRAQAAKIIAMALNMNTKNVKDPGFKDVPKTDWAYGYVAALANAGIIKGYGDQFKPNEPLSRAQMAKIIALSFKLESGKLEKSPFNDVKTSDWYAEFVKPLIEKEITTGTTPTTFSPNKPVLRGQMASFIYRSEHATKGLAVTSDITNITNQEIVTEAGTYTLSADLKKWLNPTNLTVLKGAEITLVVKDGKVEKVESVELTANGSVSTDSNNPYANHVVFDAKGAVIDADIIVNADYVSLKNATIKGDLHLGKGIENSFYSDGVKVEGKTVVSDEVKASAQQTSKFYKSLAYKQYVSKFQAAVTANAKVTIVFNNSNLGTVQVSTSGVSFESTGSSTVGSVSLSGDVTFKVANSVVIPKIVIAAGVQNVVIDSDVAEIVVEGNQSVTITGSGNFGKVVADGKSTVSVQTTGRVGTLQTADKDSKFVLGNNTKVDNLVLPVGVKPQDAINNYDSVKGNVGQVGGVKNPDATAPTPPAGGGGGGGGVVTPTIGFGPAVATGNFGNEANINEMMNALFSNTSSVVQGIEIKPIFSVTNKTITVNSDNVTQGLLQWITTQWGDSSIPVTMNVSGGVPTDKQKDANWNNKYTLWINLNDLIAGTSNHEVVMTNGRKASYSLAVTGKSAEVEAMIAALPEKENFKYNDRPAYYSAANEHFILNTDLKHRIKPASLQKLDDLKALVVDWEENGSGAKVTDTKVGYDKDAGKLVLTLENAEKVAAVDISRLRINSNLDNNGSIELAGSYTMEGNKIVITLTDDKKSAVNTLITSAGGIGNTWIHLGDGSLLNDREVPAKLSPADIALETTVLTGAEVTIADYVTYKVEKGSDTYKGVQARIYLTDAEIAKLKTGDRVKVSLMKGNEVLATSISNSGKNLGSDIFKNEFEGQGNYASTFFTPNHPYPSGSWTTSEWTATANDKPTGVKVEIIRNDVAVSTVVETKNLNEQFKDGSSQETISWEEVIQASYPEVTIADYVTYKVEKDNNTYKGVQARIYLTDKEKTKLKDGDQVKVSLMKGNEVLATSTSKEGKDLATNIFLNEYDGQGNYASTIFTPNQKYPSGSWNTTDWIATEDDEPTGVKVEIIRNGVAVSEVSTENKALNESFTDATSTEAIPFSDLFQHSIDRSVTLDSNLSENTVVQFGTNFSQPALNAKDGTYGFKLVYDDEQSESLRNWYDTHKKPNVETVPAWYTYLLNTVPTSAEDTEVNAMFNLVKSGTGWKIQDGTQAAEGDPTLADTGMIIPNGFPSGIYTFKGMIEGTEVTINITVESTPQQN